MKNHTQHLPSSPEERFARRLCVRLEEGIAELDEAKLERLAFSRKLALRAQPSPRRAFATAKKPAFGLAGGALTFPGTGSSFGRKSWGLGLMAVVLVCLFGIFQVEQQHRIEELADIDSGLLSDDLPISAYADHGFNTYLKQNP